MTAAGRALDVHFQTPEGRALAARLRLQADGTVAIQVADERYGPDVERLLGQGVASEALRRRVRADEGEPFLDAVLEVLGRSTYWSVVPAPPA